MEIPSKLGFVRKGDKWIDDSILLSFFDKGDNEILVLEAGTEIGVESIKKYCDMHTSFFSARQGTGKKVLLVYDLRKSGIPGRGELWQLISMHRNCAGVGFYESVLVGTLIFTEDDFVRIGMNAIFSLMYRPVRPLRIFSYPPDSLEFARELLDPRSSESFQNFEVDPGLSMEKMTDAITKIVSVPESQRC